MLTCKELTELVTDYLEGRLSFGQRLRFQMHVGMCQHCRTYLRQMKMTVRVLGRLPEASMPANVRDDLLARFRTRLRPQTDGATAVPMSVRLLSVIEKAIGGQRGWVVAGLMLVAAFLAVFAFGLKPGPLGEGSRCLVMELGAGAILVALLGIVASARACRISVGTFVAIGMAGGLVAFAILQATCPMPDVAQHVLIFHLGGMVVAGAAGLAASRLPELR